MTSSNTGQSHVRLHTNATTEDVLGRYELGAELGTGGFSVVRTACDRETGLEVAIKAVELAKYSPSSSTLQREVEVLTKAQHDSCVRLFAVYETPRFLYLVMELVRGGELLDRILQHGAYTEARAASIIHQILSGVSYLHSLGIVHRDLKLENMLMVDADPNATGVKIADFGLSRFCSTGSGQPLATMCGSPAYVAPEILFLSQSKQEYSVAVDIWSTGIILFVLLTGYSPFSADSDAALFEQIRSGSYDVSDPAWGILSQEAKHLVDRMLTVNPVHRITADAALAHPWLLRHCQHVVPAKSSHPPTPSLSSDISRGPWEAASQMEAPLINDTLLLEMGSLSLSTVKKGSPRGEEQQKRAGRGRRAADAVFGSGTGMRSRASSEAGDDNDEPEQPETPGQAERMRRPNLLDSDNGGMLVNLHDLM